MNLLKRRREVTRIAFNRQAETLGLLLDAEIGDIPKIKIAWNILQPTWEALKEKDNEIVEEMYLEDKHVEEIDGEVVSTEAFRSKYETLKYLVSEISQLERDENKAEFQSNATIRTRRKLKLPKIELRKFSGDLKDWLPFWSQFKRIHEDETLDSDDKYNVLLQSTVPGSRARNIVESYHPSDENYGKVVDALKARYGREDILIEVYIRDVLGLVVQNNKPNPLSLVQLYDKLESYLRSLDTLGVTTGKCACILCPMLEACMPEDFLRAWQRNSSSDDVKDPTKRLENLMKFMKSEVENEERISLARSGFSGKTPKISTRQTESKAKEETKGPSTASGLLTTQTRSLCIFCEGKHSSIDCIRARDEMSFSEKSRIVKNKRCCFLCLKANHIAKNCRSKPKCSVCGRSHVVVFCREIQKSKEPEHVSDSSTTSNDVTQNRVLANLNCEAAGVLLPTLMVTLRGRKPRTLRAIVDTGAQRSYILKSVADAVGLKPVRKEVIVHSLFGGQRSGSCDHQVYRINISSLDEEYFCNFEVLDQDTICDSLPHVPLQIQGMKDFRDKGIVFSDVGDGSSSVQLLIGADVAGQLYTGNVEIQSNGLVALQTRLGWAMMGRMPSYPHTESMAMMVTNMMINEMSVADLWKLETIGITDPSEHKTESELQEVKAKCEEHKVPTYSRGTVDVLQNNFYMDNLISSFNDEETLEEFRKEATEITEKGKCDLRCRFRKEYFGQLAKRAKKKGRADVRIGDVVFVESDNSKEIDWILAKVVALIPGPDKTTRLVRLATAAGEILRPIQRLYPLLEAQEAAGCSNLPLGVEVEAALLSTSVGGCRRQTL
uniref:DUF5641 domain-containing protein n=1 Tax=Lygus hesperus TaxID=30085 RepID=A0A146LII4_LYGHE